MSSHSSSSSSASSHEASHSPEQEGVGVSPRDQTQTQVPISAKDSFNEALKTFRGQVAKQVVSFYDPNQVFWTYYEWGPRKMIPLVMIAGAFFKADCFFQQFLKICPKGYRLISVQMPEGGSVSTPLDWAKSFDRFLDSVGVHGKVHLFGSDLGGLLAQAYREYRPLRVQTTILCNSMPTTKYFDTSFNISGLYELLPMFMLQNSIISKIQVPALRPSLRLAADYLVEQINTMKREELIAFARLFHSGFRLNQQKAAASPSESFTAIESVDDYLFPSRGKDVLKELFGVQRVVQLKIGGPYPFLSVPEDINVNILIHLRHHGLFSNGMTEEEIIHLKTMGDTIEGDNNIPVVDH